MSAPQLYEEYWKFTLAYTNFNGSKFLAVLKICIEFCDTHKDIPYSEAKYAKLQELIISQIGITDISARKAINQLVKMGFINTYLISYNPDAKNYLEARSNRKRRSILSKIIYAQSSFNRAVNQVSDLHQINFLINTLVEVGEMTKTDILALMLVDITQYDAGYIDRPTLDSYVRQAKAIDFIERKYNQFAYIINLLKKLDDVVFVSDRLYFTEDAKNLFGEMFEKHTNRRDPYLHLIYKNQLKEESMQVFGSVKCMVEEQAFPVLIASHIKPFIRSTAEEAYDPENGILLSQNLDGLFDKGNISFSDSGDIIIAPTLDHDLKQSLANLKINQAFLTNKRLIYLQYHRTLHAERLLS